MVTNKKGVAARMFFGAIMALVNKAGSGCACRKNLVSKIL